MSRLRDLGIGCVGVYFEILLLDLELIYDGLLQFLSTVFMLRSGIRGHTYPRLMLT